MSSVIAVHIVLQSKQDQGIEDHRKRIELVKTASISQGNSCSGICTSMNFFGNVHHIGRHVTLPMCSILAFFSFTISHASAD